MRPPLSHAAGAEGGLGESLLLRDTQTQAEATPARWQDQMPPAARTPLGLLAAVLAGAIGGGVLGMQAICIVCGLLLGFDTGCPACICAASRPPCPLALPPSSCLHVRQASSRRPSRAALAVPRTDH